MDNLVYHADEAVSFALSINLASSILCCYCCYSDSGCGYSSLDNPYSERCRPRHPEFDLIIPSPLLSIPTHLCNHLMSVRIPCRRCQEPHLLRAARRPAVRPARAGWPCGRSRRGAPERPTRLYRRRRRRRHHYSPCSCLDDTVRPTLGPCD